MISVFYIGLDRFSSLTRANHQRLFDELNKIAPTQIHNFLQPNFSRQDCPITGTVGAAGGLQTWDFMKAVQMVDGDIVIKLRTDVWFCDSAYQHVIDEVKSIMSGETDVAYIGANAQSNYDKPFVKWRAPEHKKVPDFVIVAKRSEVMEIDRVSKHLAEAGDVANGNKTFKIITKDLNRSVCVNNYTFLIRNDRTPLDDWNVGLDFYKSYAHGGEAATHWVYSVARKKSFVKNAAIVYVGADRFNEIGLPNHESIIKKIQNIIPTQVYSFTHSYPQRGQCPWQESGAAQVWDFIESANRVSEDLIIKFRPDLWFTESSEQALLQQLQTILDDQVDAAFMGSNWRDYLGHENTVLPSHQCATLQDFVVMVRRSMLMTRQTAYQSLATAGGGKRACGTKVFKSVLQPYARANNVYCQIYLVRKTYDKVDPWQVGLDYIMSYKKQWKMPNALPWYMSTKI